MFLSCWNEQKVPPLTRIEEVFIHPCSKRTVMCLCGVTGRSGQFSPNSSVKVVTGHVRSWFSLSGTLLESIGRWDSASGHFTSQRLVAPDDFTLIKWTDRTLRQRPVIPELASGQYLTLHLLPIRISLWMKLTSIVLRSIPKLPSTKFDRCAPHLIH